MTNTISLEDKLPPRKYFWGDTIDYDMPGEIESSLILFSRLHRLDYDPLSLFSLANSHLCDVLHEDRFEFTYLIGISENMDWFCEDLTYDSKNINLKIPIYDSSALNHMNEHYSDEFDSEELVDIVYSSLITSFFEQYNNKIIDFCAIELPNKRVLRKWAMEDYDDELLDYLSQNKFHGMSPTRLIGETKYWNLN